MGRHTEVGYVAGTEMPLFMRRGRLVDLHGTDHTDDAVGALAAGRRSGGRDHFVIEDPSVARKLRRVAKRRGRR
jgi:hypothetical protein